MKFLMVIVMAFLLITTPVIFESCFCVCGCFNGGDQPTYDFEGMTMQLHSRPNGNVLPMTATKLSEVSFQVEIDAKAISMMEAKGTAAYACTPALEVFNQQITSIVITSNNDFVGTPATIFKGNDLSILFYVVTDMGRYPASVILNRQFLGRRFYFESDSKLDSPQTHIFTFHITLSDGQEYEMVTRELSLLAD